MRRDSKGRKQEASDLRERSDCIEEVEEGKLMKAIIRMNGWSEEEGVSELGGRRNECDGKMH